MIPNANLFDFLLERQGLLGHAHQDQLWWRLIDLQRLEDCSISVEEKTNISRSQDDPGQLQRGHEVVGLQDGWQCARAGTS